MSRETALVTADWVEEHLDDRQRRLRRGRRGHHRLRRRPHPGRRQARLEDRPAGPGPPRLRRQGAVSRRCSPSAGIANDDTVVLYGGNNNWFAAYAYWYFKLYGHQDVKLLDGGRKKWELDGRALTDERARAARRRRYTAAGPGHLASAPSATRSSPRSARKNLVDVRSPDEFAGKLLAPAHLPQEQAQRAGHIPTAINVPWSKAANDDGTFKSDDELTRALRRGRRWTATRTPSPTAASASARRTPGSCCRSCSGSRTSRTTTAPGPSTAPWSASPWPSVTSGVRPDVRRDRGRARRSTASTSPRRP